MKALLKGSLVGTVSSAHREVTGRQDLTGVHRDQPVKALRLVHVRRSDHYAHAGATGRGCDRSVPRTVAAASGSTPRGRFRRVSTDQDHE